MGENRRVQERLGEYTRVHESTLYHSNHHKVVILTLFCSLLVLTVILIHACLPFIPFFSPNCNFAFQSLLIFNQHFSSPYSFHSILQLNFLSTSHHPHAHLFIFSFPLNLSISPSHPLLCFP